MLPQISNVPGIFAAVIVAAILLLFVFGLRMAMAGDSESPSGARKRRGAAALDPRIRALMVGRPPAERFIIAMAARQLDPDEVTEIMSDANLATAAAGDVNEIVAGAPFHNWLGKTYEEIRRELGGDEEKAAEVERAFDAREMKIADRPERMTAARQHEARGQFAGGDRRKLGSIITTDDSGNPVAGTGRSSNPGPTEPTFGDAQIPLSELAGMDDRDLLAIEGIGPNTIPLIRKAQEQAEEQARAAKSPGSGGRRQGGGSGGGRKQGDEDDEPTVGTAKIPISKLFGKSDEEILANEGVGPATLEEIRAAEKKTSRK